MKKPTLEEAAGVLLDEIDGLRPNEMVGKINPIAIANLRAAMRSERRRK